MDHVAPHFVYDGSIYIQLPLLPVYHQLKPKPKPKPKLTLHIMSHTTNDREDSSTSSSPSPSPSPKRRAGRKKFRETRHPIYRGVRTRNNGKWVCEIREPNKKSRIWLGTYSTPEMAARAHDVAAIALKGETAALNFPDSRWALPRARLGSADEIRRAASKAAKMYGGQQQHQQNEKMATDTILERSSGGQLAMDVTVDEEPFVDEIQHATNEVTEIHGQKPRREKLATDTILEKSSGGQLVVEVALDEEPRVFEDEEAMLNMPELLREMAEGMMVTPPGVVKEGGFDFWYNNYNNENNSNGSGGGGDGDQEYGQFSMSLWRS